MTQKEHDDFKLYGCASACLIRLSELRDIPISKEDFVRRYTHLFQFGRCGLLTTDRVCEIVMGWGIYGAAYAIRNPREIRDIFINSQNADALVFTDLRLDEKSGTMVPHFHCQLAVGWADSGMQDVPQVGLYSPYSDSEPVEDWVPLSHLEQRLVHFLLLS